MLICLRHFFDRNNSLCTVKIGAEAAGYRLTDKKCWVPIEAVKRSSLLHEDLGFYYISFGIYKDHGRDDKPYSERMYLMNLEWKW